MSPSSSVVGLFCFVGVVGARSAISNLRKFPASSFCGSLGKFSNDASASIPNSRKKSNIYTRTGDKGTSSLYNGERRSKTDAIFHALGHQDELNAVLGIAVEHCLVSNNGLQSKIVEIQSRLFDLGAAIATPVNNSSEQKIAYTQFPSTHLETLEAWIDELDAQLPPLTNFVLPSGGLSATHLNLARTVCRRAERAVVPLVKDGIADNEVGRYLNRLSDFLFVAARFAAKKEGRAETVWRKSN